MIIKQSEFDSVKIDLDTILENYKTQEVSLRDIAKAFCVNDKEGELKMGEYFDRATYKEALVAEKKLNRIQQHSKKGLFKTISFPRNVATNYLDASSFVDRVIEYEMEHGEGTYFPMALPKNMRSEDK